MDRDESDVFANRDEPVPLLIVTNSDDTSTSEAEGDGKRKRLKEALSVSKMKEKMQEIGHAQDEKLDSSTAGPSLHDRLFAK
jgi:carboxylesterase type B